MGLEEEIVQKEFHSIYHKALINLLYTHNQIVNEVNKTLKVFRITRQQFNVLRILRGQMPNPATVNLIKERMLDKMSDASRIVERLRVKGLIDRKSSTDDRRAVEIRISQKGLELLDKIDRHQKDFESLLHGITQEEALALNNLLDKIRSGNRFGS